MICKRKVLRRTFENRRQQMLELLNCSERTTRSPHANSGPQTGSVSLTSERRVQVEGLIRDVEIALERVGDNTIGFCVDCGEEISTERLLAFPATQYCLCCQVDEKQEDDAQMVYAWWKDMV